MRNLSARLGEYRGRDRVLAAQLLARPNGGKQGNENSIGATWTGKEAKQSPSCNVDHSLCVHWTNVGHHAPPNPGNKAIPNQVAVTLDEMENVWDTEVTTFGYRAPLKDNHASHDAGHGFDVYLSDIGGRGYYGYCAPDDSRKMNSQAGYCVLDDDFSSRQFPNHTPLENLQVTAAHEFFHAIQFAYDTYEDRWFMEGTAAWIEDEVYDNVNDNRQYLRFSQFVHPGQPLDNGSGISVYGSWGYFRYLSEHYGRDLIREAWERADATKGAANDYSLLALKRVMKVEGDDSHDVYADFAQSLLNPADNFEEGAAYPSPHLSATKLGGAKKTTGWLKSNLNHLSIGYHKVAPSQNGSSHAHLRVRVDGPDLNTQPRARVVVSYQNGTVTPHVVHLDRHGDGAVTVDFGRGTVTDVTAALINSSDRFNHCYRGNTPYSCYGGTPSDDHQGFAVSFSLT